jgi:lactococcin 972 family bacteriocin
MNTTKKAIVGVALAAALAVGPSALASAAPTEVLGSGAQAGGVEITDGQSGARSTAASRVADGSFWQWGVGVHDTYSNYFRERSCHGATAVGIKSKRVTNVKGGAYAKALTPKARSGNKAYYHNC